MTNLAPKMTNLAPKMTNLAPKMTDLAPENLAPEMTDLAPEMTDLAPEMTDSDSVYTCSKCFHAFSKQANLTRHLESGKCPGAPRLTCPHCLKSFGNSQQKYKHKQRAKCVPISASVNGDHNSVAIGDNNTVVNVEHLHVTTVDLKDFGKENIEKVLSNEVREWIASMSSFPAKQLGLAKAVWCNADVPENHNLKEQSIKRRDCSVRVEETWVTLLMTELIADIRFELDRISMRHPELKATRNVEGMKLVIRDRVASRWMSLNDDAQVEAKVNEELATEVRLEDKHINRDLKLMIKAAEAARKKPLKIPRPITAGILDFYDLSHFSSSRLEDIISDCHNPEQFTLTCLHSHFSGETNAMSVFPRQPSNTVSIFTAGAWEAHTLTTFLPALISKSYLLTERCVDNRKRLLESGEKISAFGPKAHQIDRYISIAKDVWERFASAPDAIASRVEGALSHNASKVYRVLVSRLPFEG